MCITKILSDSWNFMKKNPAVIIPGMAAGLIHSLILILITPLIGNLYRSMAGHPINFLSTLNISSIVFLEGAFFLTLLSSFYVSLWVISIVANRKKSLAYTATLSLKKLPIVLVATIIFFVLVTGGFMLLVIPGIYLSLRLIFFTQAIILENKDVFSSLQRSWTLTEGKVLNTFIFLLSILLILFISSVPDILVDNTVFNSIYSFVVMSLFLPLFYIALTIYYNKLRKKIF